MNQVELIKKLAELLRQADEIYESLDTKHRLWLEETFERHRLLSEPEFETQAKAIDGMFADDSFVIDGNEEPDDDELDYIDEPDYTDPDGDADEAMNYLAFGSNDPTFVS